MWPRIGYAISRAMIARADSGEATFNWADVVGCAMSAGLSNAYYPPVSRTASASNRFCPPLHCDLGSPRVLHFPQSVDLVMGSLAMRRR